MILRKFVAAAGVMTMTLSGCSSSGNKSAEVDGYVFHIPKEYIVQGAISWLPVSQSEGLKFVINPADRREAQIIVTIEPKARTCHPPTPPVTNQLIAACEAATPGRKDSATFSLKKVTHANDSTQWHYELINNGSSDGIVVASCYALSDDGKSGLCTALSNYEDLVYSLGLRDADGPKLAEIHQKVRSLLRTWQIRPKVN